MVATVRRLLLVEDSPHDVELTLVALEECHPAIKQFGCLWAIVNEPSPIAGLWST